METIPLARKEGYPSDLDPEQFDRIKPMLEAARRRTKPRKVDLRDVFNAVLYVLREGCRWRALPRDYPRWSTVCYHFQFWRDHVDRESGLPLLEAVQKKTGFRGRAQGRARRAAQPAHP